MEQIAITFVAPAVEPVTDVRPTVGQTPAPLTREQAVATFGQIVCDRCLSPSKDLHSPGRGGVLLCRRCDR